MKRPRCSYRSLTSRRTRSTFLENFYLKSKRSIEKPKSRRPRGLCLHCNEESTRTARRSCSISCSEQHVEISATKPPPSQFTRGQSARRRATPAIRSAKPSSHNRDARLPRRQLHHAHGPALLAHRRRAARSPVLGPNDPQKTPYDDTGWSLPEALQRAGGARHRPAILNAPMQRVGEISGPPGSVRRGHGVRRSPITDHGIIAAALSSTS